MSFRHSEPARIPARSDGGALFHDTSYGIVSRKPVARLEIM